MKQKANTHQAGQLKYKQETCVIENKKSIGNYTGIFIPLMLAAIPFAIGRYCEFKFPDPYDSAAYVYSAQHVLAGAKLGVDEIPTAQPATLLVNMLGVSAFGFSEFGPKLLQTLFQAVALGLMFYTMRKLYGGLSAAIGLIIAAVFLSAPLIAKFGNVKEQHMIAFMIIGVCTYVLMQLGGRWWLAILAGAALGWAPMFKPTGISAIAGVGVFMLAQLLTKTRSIKQTATDAGLLAAGFLIGVGPVWIWLCSVNYYAYLPYRFVWDAIAAHLPLAAANGASALPSYVSGAWSDGGILAMLKKEAPMILRYYGCLSLPIALASLSLILWIPRQIKNIFARTVQGPPAYDKFVILFAAWWIIDMALVWVSPRGYEQYFLPLNASAAMLGGYAVARYRDKVIESSYHPGWVLAGLGGLLVMVIMSWHIFAGIEKSPFSGQNYGEKRRGYVQQLEMVKGGMMTWQAAGDYIREHSKPGDKIYVWGWYPGIYLRAERLSSAPQAFESAMHVMTPEVLGRNVEALLNAFKKEPPQFLVDSRKREYPNDRPPLPLWPTIPGQGAAGFELVSGSSTELDSFDKQYIELLRGAFKDGEADRYIAMKPLRDYVVSNYDIVGLFGEHVLFALKQKDGSKQ